MQENSSVYNKSNPFLSKVKDRYSLCKPGSLKNVQHTVLDLEGSGITYQVGDSVAIMPVNSPEVVERTIHAMKASGEELIVEKGTEKTWKLRDFLRKRANLSVMSRKVISEICHRQSDYLKKAQLEELLKDGHKQLLANYVEVHFIWDALLDNPDVFFTPQELCSLLMPLLPRFYSIASSMSVVGEEVHLTVSGLEYVSGGHLRHGVCTRYLLHEVKLNDPIVPLYIQPNHGFTLPEDSSRSLIMVGPGTGVAPFRGFMQERAATDAQGKNWLFFGEWNRQHHFFYEDEWKQWQREGKLRLDVAFSRDQDYKVYVQHRMLEHAEELFRWLEDGALFYVCGDAHRMAKDVDAALHQIIREQGRRDEEWAKAYVKKLRADKRYLRDIY